MQIFPNGILRWFGSVTADLDEYGMPVAADTSSSMECRCTITTASEKRNATYDGGAVKLATYTVTCNMEDAGEGFSPHTVHLVHDIKGDLGMFQVQRIEYYTITQTIELWV